MESWQGTARGDRCGRQRLDQRAAELKGAEADYSARSSHIRALITGKPIAA